MGSEVAMESNVIPVDRNAADAKRFGSRSRRGRPAILPQLIYLKRVSLPGVIADVRNSAVLR